MNEQDKDRDISASSSATNSEFILLKGMVIPFDTTSHDGEKVQSEDDGPTRIQVPTTNGGTTFPRDAGMVSDAKHADRGRTRGLTRGSTEVTMTSQDPVLSCGVDWRHDPEHEDFNDSLCVFGRDSELRCPGGRVSNPALSTCESPDGREEVSDRLSLPRSPTPTTPGTPNFTL